MTFTSAKAHLRRGTYLSVAAPEKNGKSYWFMGSEGPHYLLDLDYGFDEALEKRIADGDLDDVQYERYPIYSDSSPEEIAGQMKRLASDFHEALSLADKSGGTVGLDTGSKWWAWTQCLYVPEYLDAFRKSGTAQLSGADRRHYGAANAKAEALFGMPQLFENANCVILHQAHPKFVDAGTLDWNVLTPNAFKGVAQCADAEFVFRMKQPSDPAKDWKDTTSRGWFTAVRRSRELMGQPYDDPTWAEIAEIVRRVA